MLACVHKGTHLPRRATGKRVKTIGKQVQLDAHAVPHHTHSHFYTLLSPHMQVFFHTYHVTQHLGVGAERVEAVGEAQQLQIGAHAVQILRLLQLLVRLVAVRGTLYTNTNLLSENYTIV